MQRGYEWAAAGLIGLAIGGCGGAGFSTDIRVPVEQRHALAAKPGDQIRLPGDRLFNVHLKTSSQDPGAFGRAVGESDAAPDGEAFCKATVSDGGTARAEFKLGHRLDNDTGGRLAAAIEIEFGMEQDLQAPQVPATETQSSTNLSVTVLDSHRRSLATVPAVQVTSDQACGRSRDRRSLSLPVVFEPGESYTVVLLGSVEATSASGQDARASLHVRGLGMRFSFSPAPASGPAPTQPAGR